MTLVYVDTETTGLDPSKHDVWEIAYAVDDGPIDTRVVAHDFAKADPAALRMNGYLDRTKDYHERPGDQDSRFWESALIHLLRGATLVGANPAFDATFLKARWKKTPWRYRLFDIEAYAMPALGLDEPKGLAYIAEQLRIPAPDHSARADVFTLRECHLALQHIYRGWLGIEGDK